MRGLDKALVMLVAVVAFACGEVPNTPKDSSVGDDDAPGGGPCTTNDQCSAPTPHCLSQMMCVECLQSDHCPATEPVCDTTMHACRGCTTDADCSSEVCDAVSGQCTAEAAVLYASPGGPASGTCTKAQPCSIAHANALVDATRKTIKLAAGNYSASLTLTGNKSVIVHGYGATISGGQNFVFEVEEGARLRVVGATLTTATSLANIRCESASTATPVVELFRATLDNNNVTLLANPCMLTVEQSVLRSTSTTAYLVLIVGPSVAKFDRSWFQGSSGLGGLSNANITITNSVFKSVGTPAGHGAFIGGTYNVSFSTVVDSIVECGQSGATGMTLNSSIVTYVAAGPPADTIVGVNTCASVKHTVAFPQASPIGATNATAAAQLTNPGANDYHLMSSSPAIDRGDPASTNAVDYDGVVRPTGSARDSGAFEYKP